MHDPLEGRLAQRMKGQTSSAIRDILKVVARPEIVSFAGGLPAPELFPIDAMRAAADRVLASDASHALQYGATEGVAELRAYIASEATAAAPDAPVEADQVLITTGSQQALSLISTVLLDPGDPIVVEDPSYLGALQAFRLHGARYLTVAMDDHGATPDSLATALTSGPKFAYLLPTFQNPTGRTMPLERRHAIVEQLRKHPTVLVEDDPYGALYFDRPPARSLRSLLPDTTLSLGTFSKTLAPGLRLGWVIGPRAWIARLAQVKQSADLHTATLSQHVALEVLRSGTMPAHLATLRRVYGERSRAMLDAIGAHFPLGSTWTRPTGGMFVWVELPEGTDAAALLPSVIEEEKVAYVPGSPFYANGGGANSMRLNFTHSPAEVVKDGVERLGKALTRALEAQPA